MHVAVDKGATEGQSFAFYIDYLEKEGYVTPPMRGWVKLIKDHGNESTHKLPEPERKRAEGTILFTASFCAASTRRVIWQISLHPGRNEKDALRINAAVFRRRVIDCFSFEKQKSLRI